MHYLCFTANIAADLGIAIRVISAVNKDVVGNLTELAESACPTCANITTVIKESVEVIEQTLAKIDPDWQNNPIWKVSKWLPSMLRNICDGERRAAHS